MQVNRINSTQFGSGTLDIYNPKENKFEKLNASDISEIRCHKYDGAVTITVPDYDRNIDAPRNMRYIRNIQLHKSIPLNKVLAAYTASMVAPSNATIHVL